MKEEGETGNSCAENHYPVCLSRFPSLLAPCLFRSNHVPESSSFTPFLVVLSIILFLSSRTRMCMCSICTTSSSPPLVAQPPASNGSKPARTLFLEYFARYGIQQRALTRNWDSSFRKAYNRRRSRTIIWRLLLLFLAIAVDVAVAVAVAASVIVADQSRLPPMAFTGIKPHRKRGDKENSPGLT